MDYVLELVDLMKWVTNRPGVICTGRKIFWLDFQGLKLHNRLIPETEQNKEPL